MCSVICVACSNIVKCMYICSQIHFFRVEIIPEYPSPIKDSRTQLDVGKDRVGSIVFEHPHAERHVSEWEAIKDLGERLLRNLR